MSDIDIMIVGTVNEDVLIKELDKLEDTLKREINYKLYSTASFKKAITHKEPFLLKILKNKKTMIVGDERELRAVSKR